VSRPPFFPSITFDDPPPLGSLGFGFFIFESPSVFLIGSYVLCIPVKESLGMVLHRPSKVIDCRGCSSPFRPPTRRIFLLPFLCIHWLSYNDKIHPDRFSLHTFPDVPGLPPPPDFHHPICCSFKGPLHPRHAIYFVIKGPQYRSTWVLF